MLYIIFKSLLRLSLYRGVKHKIVKIVSSRLLRTLSNEDGDADDGKEQQ